MTIAATEFHAIRTMSEGRHFFEWQGQTFFASRAELEAAIAAWKARVTPNMAARVQFEVFEMAA